MSADDRRKAIVDALLPLLVARGGEVSTREIAQAAGIAEGTIFRVFTDKRSLMLAAAEEAINPANGQELFDTAMQGVDDLRQKIVLATGRVLDRMQLTMSVMMVARRQLMASMHEEHTEHTGHAEHAGHTEHTEHTGHVKGDRPRIGPPEFVLKAQEDLNRRLTGLFEPHRAELAVAPDVAAVALRSLIFGASRPELGMAAVLSAEQIADLLLGGVLKRES
jgi:AcrR family transcriptional regulator